MRLPPTPCRVCFRPCVFNKFSHFWQKTTARSVTLVPVVLAAYLRRASPPLARLAPAPRQTSPKRKACPRRREAVARIPSALGPKLPLFSEPMPACAAIKQAIEAALRAANEGHQSMEASEAVFDQSATAAIASKSMGGTLLKQGIKLTSAALGPPRRLGIGNISLGFFTI